MLSVSSSQIIYGMLWFRHSFIGYPVYMLSVHILAALAERFHQFTSDMYWFNKLKYL